MALTSAAFDDQLSPITNSSSNDIQIMYLNVGGLMTKLQWGMLQEFIKEKDFDIICLGETMIDKADEKNVSSWHCSAFNSCMFSITSLFTSCHSWVSKHFSHCLAIILASPGLPVFLILSAILSLPRNSAFLHWYRVSASG